MELTKEDIKKLEDDLKLQDKNAALQAFFNNAIRKALEDKKRNAKS